MNGRTDQQLLRDYAERRSDAAFGELVQRHIDLVYSATLRMVRDAHLAEDVTQGVFVALARSAVQLQDHAVLAGWLHRTAQNLAANAVRSDVRRRAREHEAAAMNELLDAGPEADWEGVEPKLDAALGQLSEPDRDALLMRYFQQKSAHEIGQALRVSDEAAQKRVNRAVERLRDLLNKQGVTVGASGLALLLSANAVQAAPVGLAASVSASAALAGVTAATSATISTAKAITMTAFQKTLIGTALIAAVGTGFYEAHQASRLQEENRKLEQQQAPLADQVRALQRERDEMRTQLAAVQAQAAQPKPGSNTGEILRLRGEVGTLRQRVASSEAKASAPSSGMAKWLSDPNMAEYMRHAAADKIKALYAPLFQELKLTPEQREKFGEIFGNHATNALGRLSGMSQGAPEQGASAKGVEGGESELANQVRSLLGDTGFARWAEFSQELPGRTAAELLRSELGSQPLNEEQAARLIQAVKAEPRELMTGLLGSPDMAFLGSQVDIDNFLQRVADSNQRIVQQASSFLTPEQTSVLSTVLSNSITTRKLQSAVLVQKH
jgi:RNA polymerase sigma factor (sigma-70 family)